MIQITITEELIKRAKAIGLTSENFGSALVALIALDTNNIHLLDILDDHSKERRAFVLYQTLVRIGLMEENPEGNTYYRVTEAGKAFVNSFMEKEVTIEQKHDRTHVNEWIDEWVELFPEGIRSGGKLLRSDRKSCHIKMVQFLKDYPMYDKETIFKATERYLADRKEQDWAYTRCAVYFINKKGEGSELAAACGDEKFGTTENVPQTGMI